MCFGFVLAEVDFGNLLAEVWFWPTGAVPPLTCFGCILVEVDFGGVLVDVDFLPSEPALFWAKTVPNINAAAIKTALIFFMLSFRASPENSRHKATRRVPGTGKAGVSGFPYGRRRVLCRWLTRSYSRRSWRERRKRPQAIDRSPWPESRRSTGWKSKA
jgi:hypothetical protein